MSINYIQYMSTPLPPSLPTQGRFERERQPAPVSSASARLAHVPGIRGGSGGASLHHTASPPSYPNGARNDPPNHARNREGADALFSLPGLTDVKEHWEVTYSWRVWCASLFTAGTGLSEHFSIIISEVFFASCFLAGAGGRGRGGGWGDFSEYLFYFMVPSVCVCACLFGLVRTKLQA